MLTQNLAISNAEFNIRANVLVPGLDQHPDGGRQPHRRDRRLCDEVIAKRDAQVPLNQKMGSAWEVASGALFLCSEEARFITGVSLVIDGGQSLRIG